MGRIKILKELRPVRADLKDIEELEKLIKKAFLEIIYKPILLELGENSTKLSNEKNQALIDALKAGSIRYRGMGFQGRFSAAISKELKELGAVYDKGMKSWLIARHMLPRRLQNVIDQSERRFQKRIEGVQAVISKIVPEKITGLIKSARIFERMLEKTDRDIRAGLKAVTIEPKLSDEARERIAAEWTNNMDLYIKNFTEAEIKRLRKTVMQSTIQGLRYETMIKKIQRRYGVTERKAHFWARQETNLLLSKMKEIRYDEAGVRWYRWKCVVGSPAHPVRPSHKALDGKIFRFDQPPITTGPGQPVRRNNPGQDYNCRCVAIPLLIDEA